LRKRIKNSLSVKVFLWIAGLLILCSLVIYGIIMLTLPQSYEIVVGGKVQDDANVLISKLYNVSFEDGTALINDFSIKYDAYIMLTTEGVSKSFGERPEGSSAITVTSNIQFTDRTAGSTLTILVNTSAQAEITTAFLKLLPYIILFIFLISFIGAFLCSRILVKPIIQISSISKRMSELDMTWHCTVNRTDELGMLANSLNAMADKLNTSMRELEDANQKLSEDITSAKKMEKQRRDFFAAVSHELKTPITLIKAQVESMVMGIGDYKNHEKYLPMVLSATEDMEVLVKEILTIAKMEAMGLEDRMKDTDVASIIQECVEGVQPLADEKQITVKTNIQENQVISAEPPLFKKAISNVIINAVRHSPAGSDVLIRLADKQLTIENTGVTIPSDDLPYLFTPFYRAEKSRNRSTGGSGLGLYIVKTILDLHRLDYRIENGIQSVLLTVNLSPK